MMAPTPKSNLTDVSILDRFSDLHEAVSEIRAGQARVETTLATLTANMTRCNDHADRLRKTEINVHGLKTTIAVVGGLGGILISIVGVIAAFL